MQSYICSDYSKANAFQKSKIYFRIVKNVQRDNSELLRSQYSTFQTIRCSIGLQEIIFPSRFWLSETNIFPYDSKSC